MKKENMKIKKTIQKSRIWEFCMVFCIMLMLPVNISLIFSKKENSQIKSQDTMSEEESVSVKDVFKSSLEWAVLHELAGTIPIDYELETLKAQAIILRTNILADQALADQIREDSSSSNRDERKEIDRPILLYAYRDVWGEDYEKNCEKLYEAVIQTRGMYLEKDHEPMHASYFRLSNGSTRNASECMEGDYPEYPAVECRKDLMSQDFLKRKEIDGITFAEKISSMTGQTISYEQLKETEVIYLDDSAGYVLEINIGGERIGGEIFRQAFSLPSSDFYITYEGENVWIETKGTGTGIGFCQYGANEMAKEGEDFLNLLEYFFTNIAISKTE